MVGTRKSTGAQNLLQCYSAAHQDRVVIKMALLFLIYNLIDIICFIFEDAHHPTHLFIRRMQNNYFKLCYGKISGAIDKG